MKALVVASSAFPRWKDDTAPAFVYDLSRRLRGKGIDISVLAPHHPGAARLEALDGMKVHRFRYFLPSSLERLCYDGGILPNMKKSFLARLQMPFLIAAEFFSLYGLARKEKPGLIHAHWILPQGFTAAIVGKLLGIPIIVTAHAGDVFPLNKPLFRMLSRFSMKAAAAVTANSNFTKAAVEKVGAANATVIPMGVDLKLFSSSSALEASTVRKKYGISRKNGRMVLFVGRLAEKKGVAYLIEAMKQVAKRYPLCRLVVVGDGPEKKDLIRQAQPIRENIVFAGSVPNSQLPVFYRAADVFVLPSIVAGSGDTEGLGVVLLEAIAAGCPVVASNVGGIPDVIINNKTGLLVAQKDPKEIARAIMHILGNPSLGKKLSLAARGHAARNFSWDGVSAKFRELYYAVLEGKNI